MTEGQQILLYAGIAFAVALVAPAVFALLAGIVGAWQARRDDDAVEKMVGDYPAVPPQEKQ